MSVRKAGMELIGLGEFEKAIDKVEKRYDAACQIAARAGARVILKAYKSNLRAHRQTSELEKHVKAVKWKRGKGFAGYLIGPKFPGMTAQQISYYGEWLEHGSSMNKPYPTLRPAFDENIARAKAEMVKVFRNATEGKITESDAAAILEELILGE